MNVEMNRRHEKEMADLKAKEEAAMPKQEDDAQDDDFASALLAKMTVEEKPAAVAVPEAAPAKSAAAPAPGAKKTSRAAKRKADKNEKEKEKLERLHNVEQSQNSARSQEYAMFKRILEPMGLKIREIVPDGNCLYTSLSEQLTMHGKTGVRLFSLRTLLAARRLIVLLIV
jgi:OTU domain-containing protein 6